ncbi:hypothetical protein IC614_09090 [Allosphingosinicella flava]|uniref:Uncharacterized protein n=1 Tax=Allosphingosinicella flava TaxID=2771430 RepID=A0A7T2LLG4_9SPHN|nr:hypothetical protein [Sphingosinicella flava]QPQ54490.1 hypothetical protein IC614_09090 [Sphingosinicella flava]
MREFGGLVAGLLIGFVIALAATIVAVLLFPFPDGFNPKSQADLANYYLNAPIATLGAIVAGRFLGALGGGWAAVAIGGRGWLAWVIGVILALYLLVEMSSIPHPLWMQIAGIVGPLLGAALAHRWAGRARRDAVDEEVPHDEVHEL